MLFRSCTWSHTPTKFKSTSTQLNKAPLKQFRARGWPARQMVSSQMRSRPWRKQHPCHHNQLHVHLPLLHRRPPPHQQHLVAGAHNSVGASAPPHHLFTPHIAYMLGTSAPQLVSGYSRHILGIGKRLCAACWVLAHICWRGYAECRKGQTHACVYRPTASMHAGF